MPPSWPKPANSTLPRVRFIATHMIWVRISPEAPTRAPLMISTLLLSTKPVIAAARPDSELRKEMITGMSAPPIGITSRTPASRLTAASTRQAVTTAAGTAAAKTR